jgi:hypothetical protein
MKPIAARATFSNRAKKLFGDRVSARETAREILQSRDRNTGSFVVRGRLLRTERSVAPTKKK